MPDSTTPFTQQYHDGSKAMTERQMLELAALTYGADYTNTDEDGGIVGWYGRNPEPFNPLTNDKQALRLLCIVKKWASDNRGGNAVWSEELYRALGGIELALCNGDIKKLRLDTTIAAAEIARARQECKA